MQNRYLIDTMIVMIALILLGCTSFIMIRYALLLSRHKKDSPLKFFRASVIMLSMSMLMLFALILILSPRLYRYMINRRYLPIMHSYDLNKRVVRRKK